VSDVILVLTSWGQFKDLPKIIERNGRDILVIDGRGFYDPTLFKKYEGIGYNP
jgi:UDP-glucose 6-dehydrogenase